MGRAAGAILTFAGFILFGFGIYILPFGTDAYLWFWVEKVFNGNWMYGVIAANLFALLMIAAGLIMLHRAGKKTKLVEIDSSKKTKTKKKSNKRGDEKWLRL